MSSPNTEYEKGKEEAKRHSNRTDENWIRATFGPILWLGVPLGLSWWLMRRASGSAGGKAANSMESFMEMMNPIQKRQFKVDVKGTAFKDVIGIPEAKEEVKQYVDFLTNPNKFTRLGARLPKGCLLTGEPGTGKTLLAKAVAGEANVPFFSCSGADFIEIMGGSGPKRVRELFEEARKESPCIVFIDELDAIGSRGGNNKTSTSSEENRTINQLLAELDGLTTSEDAIIVLAATNFQDNIDKALLREGRFDRKIPIDMPDLKARIEVVEHYLNKVCTGDKKGRLKNEAGEEIKPKEGVDNGKTANLIADLTPGLSPAALATIVNEAALQAGIKDKPLVELDDLLEAVDNTILGKKQRSRMSIKAIDRTAVHESGHAFLAWILPQQKKVLKISVLPRGNALGYTQKAGGEFHEYQTNATMFTDMVVMLGGRAAEEVLVGDISTGASDDLQRCTDYAMKQMLAFGMNSKAGMLSYHPESTKAGRMYVSYSEETQKLAEREASKLVKAAHDFAIEIVTKNKDKIRLMAKELESKKEVMTEDIQRIWGNRPTTPTVQELADRLEQLTGVPAEALPSSHRIGHRGAAEPVMNPEPRPFQTPMPAAS